MAKSAAEKAAAAAAAKGGDQSLAAVTEIVQSYNSWLQAKEQALAVAKAAKATIDQEFAGVKVAIEDSLPPTPTADAIKEKLTSIEERWQDYSEAVAQATEEKKHAKAELKEAAKRFDRAVKDSAQLALDFG